MVLGVARWATVRDVHGPFTYLYCTDSAENYRLKDGIYRMSPTNTVVHIENGRARDCLMLW
jgi:hypothetical protein